MTALKEHPDYRRWLEVRRLISDLDRLRAVNSYLGTAFTDLASIPVETADVIVALMAQKA